MKLEWRDLPGWEGLYQVSIIGLRSIGKLRENKVKPRNKIQYLDHKVRHGKPFYRLSVVKCQNYLSLQDYYNAAFGDGKRVYKSRTELRFIIDKVCTASESIEKMNQKLKEKIPLDEKISLLEKISICNYKLIANRQNPLVVYGNYSVAPLRN